jgi:hypothetical protein
MRQRINPSSPQIMPPVSFHLSQFEFMQPESLVMEEDCKTGKIIGQALRLALTSNRSGRPQTSQMIEVCNKSLILNG